MTKFTFQIIHPNSSAEMKLTVAAKNPNQAHADIYRKLQDTYGCNTLYMVGDIIS